MIAVGGIWFAIGGLRHAGAAAVQSREPSGQDLSLRFDSPDGVLLVHRAKEESNRGKFMTCQRDDDAYCLGQLEPVPVTRADSDFVARAVDDATAAGNFCPMPSHRQPVSLNLNIRGLGTSATLAIKERCRQLRRQGKSIFDFGLGQSPFPVPTSVVEALRLSAHEKDYLPVRGLPALRDMVADFHRRKEGVTRAGKHVLIGPGSKELMFLLQLVFYGEIILRTPCWVSYVPQAQILGRRVTLIPTTFESGWRITPENLMWSLVGANDDARPRLLVLNYPMNPTGHSYTVDELKELADVARRYELIVLSDEIYGQLHFKGEHVSIARFYPERTIISSGLSKWCGAGGWRLGTFSFPGELNWLLDALAAVASETYTSVCAPIQYAAVEAFRCGADIERYLRHVRRILRTLGRRCVELLRHGGARTQEPVGAFYLFPDFTPLRDRLAARGINTGPDLCEQLLLDTGVALLPGVSFGRPAEELTARLSYVDFDGAAALAASENIPLDTELPPEFLDRYCANVVRGVEQIAEWLGRTT